MIGYIEFAAMCAVVTVSEMPVGWARIRTGMGLPGNLPMFAEGILTATLPVGPVAGNISMAKVALVMLVGKHSAVDSIPFVLLVADIHIYSHALAGSDMAEVAFLLHVLLGIYIKMNILVVIIGAYNLPCW